MKNCHFLTASKLFAFSLLNLFITHNVLAICATDTDATPKTSIRLNGDGEFVPTWAKEAGWYQVFPERFRDGDSTNNPSVEDIVGDDPVEPPKQWQVHPWGSDWFELQAYEKANG
jgi:cyclomaltodextrinase